MAKKTWKDEVSDLAKYLSGEASLRKQKEELKKIKKEAVKRQKDLRRKNIVRGKEVLEKDDVTEKKVVQKITLFKWEAPIRFKYPIELKTFLIIVALCLLFIVYLAVLGHYGLMAALIALLFFIYVSGTTTPMKVEHKITARGIDTMGTLYEWFMLDSFWFTQRGEEVMLHVNTKLKFPGRLLLIVDKKDISSIFILLEDKLLYRDIRKESWLDKKSFGNYIKLEDI